MSFNLLWLPSLFFFSAFVQGQSFLDCDTPTTLNAGSSFILTEQDSTCLYDLTVSADVAVTLSCDAFDLRCNQGNILQIYQANANFPYFDQWFCNNNLPLPSNGGAATPGIELPARSEQTELHLTYRVLRPGNNGQMFCLISGSAGAPAAATKK